MRDPFRADDIDLYRVVTDLDAAREHAVCAVSEVDKDNDSYTSALWLLPFDGAPRRLTAGTARDESPRFAPDGHRVAFVSTRGGGSPQLYVIDTLGGEAESLASFPDGVVAFAWHPTEDRLLVTARVSVDPDKHDGDDRECEARKDDAPEVAWRLPYKSDGMGYTLDREIHLYSLDIGSGDVRRLTHGAFDVRSAEWSPDGKRVVFTRTREGRLAHRTDVWMMEADGSDATQLTTDIASVQFPRWSPDGRSIAFSGSADDGDAIVGLWLLDVESGAVRALGGDALELDSGDTVRWSKDSASLSLVRACRSLHEVVRVTLANDNNIEVLAGGPRQATRLACAGGHHVFVASSATQPIEVHLLREDGEETTLTDFNAWWADRTELDATQRDFEVPDGNDGTETISGCLVRRAGATQPMPLLVYMHGGPASHTLLDYASHPYWNILCSKGWAVLSLDAVGSSSFGRKFADRLRGHWGELDLPQHLSAIRTLQDEGIVDARIAVTGKSYCGYLSAWAIGQTTMFRAAVVAAPITNLETHYGTSDSGYYADRYSLDGTPIEGSERNRRLSPMHYASCSDTPTLILQGKDDERCPICQAEVLYTVLMASTETPVELVLYPGGSHHFFEQGRPSHRRDAAQRLCDWVERWIDQAPAPRDPDHPRMSAAGRPCESAEHGERAEPNDEG